MSASDKVRVKDESRDRVYFIITPRLVWAFCDNPDEYTLWSVVKDIAGENGECILARDDLAALAMMSAGRVSQCRDSLANKKLLIAEFRRDPGYPQAVWHLSIPDIWEANVRWARQHIQLKDRIAYKRDRLELLKEQKEASRDDASKEPSRGDRGITQNDGGITPDDAKKNVLKNQKEEGIGNAWESVIEQLKRGVTRAVYERYLRDTRVCRYDGNVLEIAVANADARDWLEDRLQTTAERLLVGIMNASVTVSFVVAEPAEAEG